ncbi:hypothetical protein [Vibrio phage VCPH]|nr:hypothetical protein [Vibrio phage VCPH]
MQTKMLNKSRVVEFARESYIQEAAQFFRGLGSIGVKYNSGGKHLIEAYRQTLRMGNKNYQTWADFINAAPERDGYTLEKRFRGWAANSPFPAVMFYSIKTHEVCLVMDVEGDTVVTLSSHGLLKEQMKHVFPIFVSKLDIDYERIRAIETVQHKVESYIRGKFRVRNMNQNDVLGTHNRRIDVQDNGDIFITTKNKTFQAINESESTMKNTNKLNKAASNLLQVEKDAAVQTAYLTAGRTSNKLVKEAVRPILNLIFKPTAMQRLGMRIFGATNPIDKFMDSPASDAVCSRLFRILLELKGNNDERVLEAANAAIVYSNVKVGDEIPIEELIDAAIKQVSDGIDKLDVAEKVKKAIK